MFGPISLPFVDDANAPLVRWVVGRARAFGRYAVVQAIVQIIGFFSGILIIRHLEQRDYAYFTIANTMQGTLNLLADMGISIGVVSIGGRVWQDRRRFGELVTTALSIRRKLGGLAIILVTPVLYFLLKKNGAPVGYAFVLILLVLAGVLAQLGIGVLSVVPRLRSDLGRIQWIDFVTALARLAALVALLFILLNAGVAVAVGSAALLLQYVMLRRYADAVIDRHAPENAEDAAAMRGFIRNQAANAIFYCLQGQITVFLISIFAHRVSAVAEVGALGRLAMIFAVLTNLLTNIFAPAFARCQSPRRLRWQFAGTVGAVALFCAAILASAGLFPDKFLLILGGKYSHLDRALLLMIGGAAIHAIVGTIWALNAAMAWVAGAWLYVPLTIGTQVCLIPFIDFSSVEGVLVFNLLSGVPNLLLNLVLSFRGFRGFHPRAA